jgi:hypothetical protein
MNRRGPDKVFPAILATLALLLGAGGAAAQSAADIDAWLTEEGYEFVTYDDEPDTWYLSAAGENMAAIPVIIYTQQNFVCFQCSVATIPSQSHGDLDALKDELLAIGLENYLVKAVINSSNEVEIQAEFPAAALARDDFLTGLYLVVGTADAEYNRILEYVYR